MMVMLITIMIKIMNVEYIWPTSLMKCESFAVTYDFNQPIYAVCGLPWPRSRVRSLPHPVEFWTSPAPPYETKTFPVPVHPCYVVNDNLSQMGASLVPEGVTAEEGSQRVMPWGYLVYR